MKHTLTEEEGLDLVPTTDLIRNINVVYDEVYAREEDFVIIDTTEKIKDIEVEAEEIRAKEEREQQTTLSFDMPLSAKKKESTQKSNIRSGSENDEEKANTITFDMNKDARNYDVKDHVEVVPVTEVSEEGVRRYSLDDYMEMENKLSKAKPTTKKTEVVDEELAIEKKVVEEPAGEGKTREVDPFNTSIEDSLKLRTEERRKKLKEFNYKFNNSTSKIDEIEKQPAYKRMGVELQERTSDDGTSRISVGKDSNDDVQLRSNNSFLHDNVD